MSFGKYERLKKNMIEAQLRQRGITDSNVLNAFSKVDRIHFVDEGFEVQAYEDSALPIHCEQTISQPYMVAFMTQELMLSGSEKVLEIGTGSGFQSAIISAIGCDTYSIERHQALFLKSKQRLTSLRLRVKQRCGDGTLGWTENGPYDRIIVTAGAPEIPMSLCEQLADGGFMLIPVGVEKSKQELYKVIRTNNQLNYENLGDCSFVPLIGKDGWSS